MISIVSVYEKMSKGLNNSKKLNRNTTSLNKKQNNIDLWPCYYSRSASIQISWIQTNISYMVLFEHPTDQRQKIYLKNNTKKIFQAQTRIHREEHCHFSSNLCTSSISQDQYLFLSNFSSRLHIYFPFRFLICKYFC